MTTSRCVRSGRIAARALSRAARAQTLTRICARPAASCQTLAESSFDAWIKFYRQNENTPNAGVSYYAKGALVGCALDLTLRREARASLDDIMRALWNRYGRQGVGVPEGGIEALASEIAGRDLSQFFARYVHGTEDLPLADLLHEFAVTLHLRPSHGTKDRGGKAGTGTPPRCMLGVRAGADQRLAAVLHDGPAARAGLSGHDTLVAIDGFKASPEALATVLARHVPGDAIDVHAFRRDELMAFRVTLGEPATDTCYLVLDATPAADAKARRDAWLRG